MGSGIGLLGGPIGGLIGASLGHLFDQQRGSNYETSRDATKAKLLFYAHFFCCAAKVAKADGGISSDEIATTEALISRMKLSAELEEFSKKIFRKSKSLANPIREDLLSLAKLIRHDQLLARSFLGGLYEIACSGNSKPSELQVRCLLMGEEILRLPKGTIKSWIEGEYIPCSFSFKDTSKNQAGNGWAYRLLGISQSVSNEDIKTAYRSKMALLHPDKLAAKNVPEELLTFTTEQVSLLNEAYQCIGKERGFKR